MKASHCILDIDKMFQNNFVAIEISKGYPYNNGVRSEVADCEKVTVVLPTLAFEKITVKMPLGTATSVIGTEITSGGVPVLFDNLIVTPYISNGNLGLSAKADGVRLAGATKNEQAKQ